MATDVKKITDDARKLWAKLTPGRKVLLIGALAATVAGVAFMGLHTPAEKWAVLFSGLTPEDAGQVVDQLKAQKVQYKLDANGTTVDVPEDKVHELRITLASAGIPRGGGVGFE